MNKSVKLIAMSKAWVRALVVAALVGLPAAVYGAGVAMVTDLQGKATTSVDGRGRDITILAEIDAGAQFQLAPGATLVALYLDAGDEYVFNGPASIFFIGKFPKSNR